MSLTCFDGHLVHHDDVLHVDDGHSARGVDGEVVVGDVCPVQREPHRVVRQPLGDVHDLQR